MTGGEFSPIHPSGKDGLNSPVPSRAQILAAVKLILANLVERKLSTIPTMFKPLLKDFSPEGLVAMLEGEISEEDWAKIEAIFLENESSSK